MAVDLITTTKDERQKTCEVCKTVYLRKPFEYHQLKVWSRRKYCSRQCSGIGRRKVTTLADFLVRTEMRGDCLEWMGKRNRNGYGYLSWFLRHRKTLSETAHRVSWELHTGEDPGEMWVLHKCDNPPCVNIDHLYLGDHKNNMRDMAVRGRHGRAKLARAQVKEIKKMLAGGANTSDLARAFGVSKGHMNDIKSGRKQIHI